MAKKEIPFLAHIGFLSLLVIGSTVLWSLPSLAMGGGYDIFPLLAVRNFLETGLFSMHNDAGAVLSIDLLQYIGKPSAGDGRLSMMLISLLFGGIPWNDTVSWTMAGANVAAFSLVFWWLFVSKVFSKSIAWTSTIILALMPAMFLQATWFDNYTFSILFLFASFAVFVWLRPKSVYGSLIAFGVLFGASAASKDVFLIFVPWLCIAYILWQQCALRDRVLHIGVAGFCMLAVYLVPYIGDIQELGYPYNQNLARLWPGAGAIANETYLHMYPDPYTYYHNRDEFESAFIAKMEGKSFADRMMDQKVLLAYGVEESIVARFVLGSWLLLNDIPTFFQRDTVGGIFLWLFILPGIVALWSTNRRLLWQIVGLVGSMYFIIRFVLGYERSHFINVVWAFALFAALGIENVAGLITQSLKNVSVWRIATIITVVICLQLLQANRFVFAERYRRSSVDHVLAMGHAVAKLPEGAVVATPLHPSVVEQVALLSDRTIVLFAEETIRALKREDLFPKTTHGYITHLLEYAPDVERAVLSEAPELEIVDVQSTPPQKVSGGLRYLIHLVR